MKLLPAYLMRLARRWSLWLFLVLDALGAVSDIVFGEDLALPRWAYVTVVLAGVTWASFRVWSEDQVTISDLRNVLDVPAELRIEVDEDAIEAHQFRRGEWDGQAVHEVTKINIPVILKNPDIKRDLVVYDVEVRDGDRLQPPSMIEVMFKGQKQWMYPIAGNRIVPGLLNTRQPKKVKASMREDCLIAVEAPSAKEDYGLLITMSDNFDRRYSRRVNVHVTSRN